MEVKHYKRGRYNYRELKPPESEREKQRFKLTPIRKVRSRLISEISTKSFEDSDYDHSIPSNKSTCSSGFMSNCSFTDVQTLSIKLFYFLYNDKKSIEIIISEDKLIKDLIIFSLNIINEQLISDKQNIQLDIQNLNNYCIKLIQNENEINKENFLVGGETLNMDSTVSDCDLGKNFFLIWKNNKKSNVLPYKRQNRNKKEIEIIVNKKIHYNNHNFVRSKKHTKSVTKRNNYYNDKDIDLSNCCLY